MMLKGLVLFALLACAVDAKNLKSSSEELSEFDLAISKQMRDLIKQLDAENFYEEIRARKGFSLTLFYSSTSKVFKLYEPTYFEAITASFNWSPMLKYYTIDCANPDNIELCRNHGYRRVPVFKYFKPKSVAGDMGERVPTYTNATILLKNVVKRINEDYLEGTCEDCPNLKMLPDWASTGNTLWKMPGHHCVKEIHLVPVESADDLFGITVLLHDHKRLKGKFPLWRVLRTNSLVNDPKISPDQKTTVTLSISEETVARCRFNAGNIHMMKDPNTKYGNRTDVVGLDDFDGKAPKRLSGPKTEALNGYQKPQKDGIKNWWEF
ncbi:Sulfhydryl oxidase [Aphelenchoides bicaudatus]|nr:Sulfhydryl oxidase [Aphelenchoides bicaudatus]